VRRRGRSDRAGEPQDEPTALAGWLYTDLLLGLAVVFLGSVAFLVPKSEPEVSAKPPRSSVPKTTTPPSSTTTLKKVRMCQSLYVPAQDAEQGIWLLLSSSSNDEQLRSEFETQLRQQFDEENAKPEVQEEGLIVFEKARLGYLRAQAGGANNSIVAQRVLDRLERMFPDLFEGSAGRAGWTDRVAVGKVGIEVLPYVSRPCRKN
jgi:hypothetical protein